MTTTCDRLVGLRVLLVEDDYFVVEDMRLEFEASGASVIGPAATVEDALNLLAGIRHLDGAVLDINLKGAMVFPVADALAERGVPFVFATGYDAGAIPPRYSHAGRCSKPVEFSKLVRTLFP